MGRPPKIHFPKTLIWVTTTVEQGMPLPPTPVMNVIIRSCLAQAQALYPVTVCDFVFMATHCHKFLLVENPEHIKDFMCRFKTESAHAINSILGRSKRTVWCEGYDSPVILSLEKAVEKLAYTYANPANANLVQSIEHYPGVTSWAALCSGEEEVVWSCPRITRPEVPFLGTKRISFTKLSQVAEQLEAAAKARQPFVINPLAWLEHYGVTDPNEKESIRKRIIRRVRALEEEAIEARQRERIEVIGTQNLREQPLDTTFLPIRDGKRMWCLSDSKEQRIAFIEFVKDLLAEAKDVVQRWIRGDMTKAFPMGLYPPSFPRRVEPLPYLYQEYYFTW